MKSGFFINLFQKLQYDKIREDKNIFDKGSTMYKSQVHRIKCRRNSLSSEYSVCTVY